MAIVVILGMLWGVVLIPTLLRRFGGSRGSQSIDSFHHSLHLLERSGPKLVQPAYRLNSVVSASAEESQFRPRLVLLRPLGQGGEEPMYDHETDVFEDDGERYERFYVESEQPPSFGASLPSDSYGRRIAARRRRNILFGLVAAVVVTGVASLVASSFFYLLIVSMLALVGYVGLMSWAATTGQFARAAGRGDTRHIAHAVARDSWGNEYDEYEEYDQYENYDAFGEFDDQRYVASPASDARWADDDGWWDEPRRVAAR